MFKKKKLEAPSAKVMEAISESDQQILREINTLSLLNSLNESNKVLGKIGNAEYESTKAYIVQRCNEIENNLTFDKAMGKPMDAIDNMMEIFK